MSAKSERLQMESFLRRLAEDPQVQLQTHVDGRVRLFHCLHVDLPPEHRRLDAVYRIIELRLCAGGPYVIATVCDHCDDYLERPSGTN